MPAEPTRARTRRAGQGRRTTPTDPADAPAEPTPPAGGGSRREARANQFLDVAAELVRQRGIGGMTMERLAEATGVSKALPYRYFENADAVFVALYQREITNLALRVVGAFAERGPDDDAVAVMVHAYFDVVAERGDLLASLAGAGSPIPDLVDPEWRGLQFVADLLGDAYGVHGRKALAMAYVFVGAVIGASDAVGQGVVSRTTAERVAVTTLQAGAEAIANG